MYVPTREAIKHFKVSEQTLRDWANSNKVKYITTKGGHRRYLIEEKQTKKKRIIYARVSSSKQKNDLIRQVKFMRRKYPKYEVVFDIGSGINYKRPKFKWILEQLFAGNIGEVVVASYDRFSRLGQGLFTWLFAKFGAKLTRVNQHIKSKSEEFIDDLMEIITVYSARYYGARKYNNKKAKILSKRRTKKAI